MKKSTKLVQVRTNIWNNTRKLNSNKKVGHQCSIDGCRSKGINIANSQYCLKHYVALKKCENPRCCKPAISGESLCKRHRYEATLEYRSGKWAKAEPLQNQTIPGVPGIEKTMHIYDCSIPNCRAVSGLRMTETGIFCEHHYFGQESCSTPGCFEPSISRIGKCYNHDPILGEDFDLTENSVVAIKSSLSLFDNPAITSVWVDFTC